MFHCSTFYRRVLSLLVTLMLAASAMAVSALPARQRGGEPASLSPAEAERIIAARARAVVEALRRRDVRGLARFAHPTRGIRFSPQPSVLPSDVILRRGELMRERRRTRPNLWGEHEAGEINLTFRQYWNQYIYTHDFAGVRDVSYNRTGGAGTNINTLRENYPRALIVGFYHPGNDPRRDGMDWGILWLMFERAGSEWFLVGIAHDEWAI